MKSMRLHPRELSDTSWDDMSDLEETRGAIQYAMDWLIHWRGYADLLTDTLAEFDGRISELESDEASLAERDHAAFSRWANPTAYLNSGR